MTRKKFILLAGVAGIVAASTASMFTLQAKETGTAASDAVPIENKVHEITIYKSPSCGCCQSWAEHLDAHGFQTIIVETENLNGIKQDHDVPRAMASCHTALINDLVIEGHVPAEDILSYLQHPQPDVVGLSVPGMPHGTPGMETGRKDDYKIFAFNSDGQTRVFREHKDY